MSGPQPNVPAGDWAALFDDYQRVLVLAADALLANTLPNRKAFLEAQRETAPHRIIQELEATLIERHKAAKRERLADQMGWER